MQDSIEGPPKRVDKQKAEPFWNVPAPLTSIIGREAEIKNICALISRPEIRLLTLLGPGGIGKTRLCIDAAVHMRSSFVDGVCFVTLAPIRNPTLVLLTIAQALCISETETQSLSHIVTTYLNKKQILLVLDNFEQVLMATHVLADILESCPAVKILVTSRATLHIQSEQEFHVQPLALPSLDQLPEYAMLTRYAAVELFLQRVQAQIPDFQITPANAQAIAEICVQLDGLPLAVELAAARIKLLPPQALLTRLSRRLQLLTSGQRTLPLRQQTLRNTLKWSYDLLDAREQQLFRRISVFAKGCSLDALEQLSATLGDTAETVLDDASSLVDKSLLLQTEQEGGEPRLMMLETIREYGLERLAESGETELVLRAHANYYLMLAEKAEPELEGPQQAIWIMQLEREHNNLQAVLLWSVAPIADTEQQEKRARQEIALRLIVALRRFWLVRGYISEGQNFLEHALAISEDNTVTLIYAKALLTLGMLTSIQGDYDRAGELCTKSLEIFRKLRDSRSVAKALYQLGRLAWMRGDLKLARSLAEDALIHSRKSGHEGSIAWSLFRLARLLIEQGEYVRGHALLEENLVLHKKMGNKRAMAASLYHLAWVHLITQSDPNTVHTLSTQAQSIFKEVRDKEGIAYSLYLSGRLAFSQNDIMTAQMQVQESEILFREMQHKEGIAWTLSLLGRIATDQYIYDKAHTLYKEALEIARELDHQGLLAFCIEGLAALIATQTIQEREGEEDSKKPTLHNVNDKFSANLYWAAQLWGSAKALRDASSLPLAPIDHAIYERSITAIRNQLGQDLFIKACSEGQMMLPQQALNKPGSKKIAITAQTHSSKTSLSSGLTSREIEVLKLVAQSLTSTQIAEQLTLSPLTVNSHVRSIYNKLGVTSRSGATRYAIKHNLI